MVFFFWKLNIQNTAKLADIKISSGSVFQNRFDIQYGKEEEEESIQPSKENLTGYHPTESVVGVDLIAGREGR